MRHINYHILFRLPLFICSLLAELSASLQVHAEELKSFISQYNISYITMRKGLPHNFVDCVYKDSRGFLWIAMQGGGLARYDGYEFLTFDNSPFRQLKSKFIRCVCEDRSGRLWVVSEGGTDLIDLHTLQTSDFLLRHEQTRRLVRQPASFVTTDATGCVWLQSGNSLHRIKTDSKGNVTSVRSLQLTDRKSTDAVCKDLDGDGRVWAAVGNRICRIGPDAAGVLRATPIASGPDLPEGTLVADLISKENEVWIATNRGIYRYNRNNHSVKHYAHDVHTSTSLSQDFTTCLAVTEQKQLIVASLCGLNVYNPIGDNFERVNTDCTPAGTPSLNSNFVNCLLTDGQYLWVGTENGGLNKLTAKRLSVNNYIHDSQRPQSLSPNPVNAIHEDRDGNLWIGTVEGGLNRKLPGSNTFSHYTMQQGTLEHNSVSAITADGEDHLWIGTWGGGITVLDRHRPQHPLMQLSTRQGIALPIDFIGALQYDARNNGVWIGANPGIYFYDLRTHRLTNPLPGVVPQEVRGCIGSLIDREGKLWMGCMDGVYIIDLQSHTDTENIFSYRHLTYKLDDPASMRFEKITCICQSHDGTLWLGSNGYGIYKRTTPNGQERFTNYSTKDGLPNNTVLGIVEDGQGCLWVSTYNGLARLNPQNGEFTNFDEYDGLASTQFYWNAACLSHSGELYFGNTAGLTAISPDLPVVHTQPGQLRFTRLVVGNREVQPGSSLLPVELGENAGISLHEREKSFSVGFSALDFAPENNAVYQYRLLGFDKEWVTADSHRPTATYTNLSPGTYTLQVRHQTGNGQADTAELTIVVRPYFYRTVWFFFLILLILILAVWQVYRWRVRNLKRQRQMLHILVEQRTKELNEQTLRLEQQAEDLSEQNLLLVKKNEKISAQKAQLAHMAHKVQELTADKIAFFTNITHEFRTPITLIINPIERALKLSSNPLVIEQLHFVERNSKYLLSLINQLMDFHKLESGMVDIVRTPGNVRNCIDEVALPFTAYARERNITLRRLDRATSTSVSFDADALRKVMTNLLGNAIKFTPGGGTITLYAAVLPAKDGARWLYLCVSDTGCGIPPEDLERIFNRFYQSRSHMNAPAQGHSGSGIGLYLCRRIVTLNGGTITARNNPGKGCSMRLLLPLEECAGFVPEQSETAALPVASTTGQGATFPETDSQLLTLLVVEDNKDMRDYIRSILRDKYRVLEAVDGEEALLVLTREHVDFIVSDLMMPRMDGIELSRRVKEDIAISHIPFLILTAKTSEQARLESFKVGVDEYLLKPFDENLLLARIENILDSRRRYQRRFALTMNVDQLPIEPGSGDRKFITQVMEVMKANYANSDFDVSNFCEAVGVSKTLLNQKLQDLVGQSAGQFIRNYRLNLARDLILVNRTSHAMNISEIAYRVGFNDPKYFTRCFSKEFKVKPSDLLNGRTDLPD